MQQDHPPTEMMRLLETLLKCAQNPIHASPKALADWRVAGEAFFVVDDHKRTRSMQAHSVSQLVSIIDRKSLCRPQVDLPDPYGKGVKFEKPTDLAFFALSTKVGEGIEMYASTLMNSASGGIVCWGLEGNDRVAGLEWDGELQGEVNQVQSTLLNQVWPAAIEEDDYEPMRIRVEPSPEGGKPRVILLYRFYPRSGITFTSPPLFLRVTDPQQVGFRFEKWVEEVVEESEEPEEEVGRDVKEEKSEIKSEVKVEEDRVLPEAVRSVTPVVAVGVGTSSDGKAKQIEEKIIALIRQFGPMLNQDVRRKLNASKFPCTKIEINRALHLCDKTGLLKHEVQGQDKLWSLPD